MKPVIVFTFIIAVMVSALIGCLMIFEVFTVKEGFDSLLRALAAIGLIGVSSALITLAISDKGAPGE